MKTGTLPPQSAMRPWFGVGEVTERLGAVGQPFKAPTEGHPAINEETLIQAHRHCTCCQTGERLPWEEWSPGQWEWYRRRQRVMARRTIQREERAAAQKAGAA